MKRKLIKLGILVALAIFSGFIDEIFHGAVLNLMVKFPAGVCIVYLIYNLLFKEESPKEQENESS